MFSCFGCFFQLIMHSGIDGFSRTQYTIGIIGRNVPAACFRHCHMIDIHVAAEEYIRKIARALCKQ